MCSALEYMLFSAGHVYARNVNPKIAIVNLKQFTWPIQICSIASCENMEESWPIGKCLVFSKKMKTAKFRMLNVLKSKIFIENYYPFS